jgi:hypothetical protein
MNKHNIVEKFISIAEEGDVIIFSGSKLCKYASNFDRRGNLYIMLEDMAVSIGLGIAMCTDRRVFVFCEDSCFLKNIDSIAQAGVSECRNFFLLILNNGRYDDEKDLYTITDRFHAVGGALFNLGFTSFDFTQYFKNKTLLKELKQLLERVNGPIVSNINVSIAKYKGSNGYSELSDVDFRDRMKMFFSDDSLNPVVFEPPTLDSLRELIGGQ